MTRKAARGQAASQEQMREISRVGSERWETIVMMSPLGAGSSSGRGPFTHLRLNIFPDGGVARLRVYGVSVPRLTPSLLSSPLDLISARLGGLCLGYSDAHYGHPRNMIKTELAINMGDGWETARRLDRPAVLVADQAGILQVPGHEWAVFRLGIRGSPSLVIIDTNHFMVNISYTSRV